MPETPTRPYTILDNKDILPKIAATKSKPNRPTNPQLTAPTMASTRAIQSTTLSCFIKLTSSSFNALKNTTK